MTIQLSDCCKATIDLDKTKERPECYTCSKCGRIIGSPLTHNTREERIKNWLDGYTYTDEYGERVIFRDKVDELLTTAAQEKEEALNYYRNHLFDVHHCNCALTPPKNISSNETTV